MTRVRVSSGSCIILALTFIGFADARALFERVIATFSPERARPLWERWARYEYQYGDLEAAQKLEKRIADVYPNGASSFIFLHGSLKPLPPIQILQLNVLPSDIYISQQMRLHNATSALPLLAKNRPHPHQHPRSVVPKPKHHSSPIFTTKSRLQRVNDLPLLTAYAEKTVV